MSSSSFTETVLGVCLPGERSQGPHGNALLCLGTKRGSAPVVMLLKPPSACLEGSSLRWARGYGEDGQGQMSWGQQGLNRTL